MIIFTGVRINYVCSASLFLFLNFEKIYAYACIPLLHHKKIYIINIYNLVSLEINIY